MKKFLFVGFNEDFEDTTIEIYEAESEEQVETCIEMNFFNVESEEELRDLEDRDRYQDFVNDNPYKLIELDNINVFKSSDYVFEGMNTKLNKVKYFVGTKKLKHVKLMEEFNDAGNEMDKTNEAYITDKGIARVKKMLLKKVDAYISELNPMSEDNTDEFFLKDFVKFSIEKE